MPTSECEKVPEGDMAGQVEVRPAAAQLRTFPDEAWSKAGFVFECRARDARCARVVSCAKIADISATLQTENHVMADVVGDGEHFVPLPPAPAPPALLPSYV